MIYFWIHNAHGPTRPWPDQSYIACYGPVKIVKSMSNVIELPLLDQCVHPMYYVMDVTYYYDKPATVG